MFDLNEMPERFRTKVTIDPETGCWVWTAALFTSGYGAYKLGKGPSYAHRVSYEHYKGRIPEGLHVDHLCSNRPCVNPDHLEAVSPKVNVRRGMGIPENRPITRGSTCREGHPYGEFGFIDSHGYRRCWVCRRESANDWARRNRAKQKDQS